MWEVVVGTYALFSAIDDISDIELSVKQRIHDLNSFLSESEFNGFINNVNEFDIDKLKDYSGIVIILMSGGTEGFSKIIIENSTAPVLLLANSEANSFAASLEIYATYKDIKNIKLFYYSNLTEVKLELYKFEIISGAINKINNSRIGIFGKPSSWLLTSEKIEKIDNFGTELDFYEIGKIPESVEKISKQDTNKAVEEIIQQYDKGNIPQEDLNSSANVYLSMKKLASENELNAISVRCFDLLSNKYTACMGMSFCNDENLVAGCEGDIQTTFSMMVGNYLTGEPCWMANPARIDKANNILTLAHCTIPGKMIADKKASLLRTHMESDLSVAIQGPMHKGEVTVFRIGGDFDKIQIATGRIIDTNMKNPHFCRTQAEILLNEDIRKWVNKSLGNHQVLVYGNITELLKEFAQFTKLEIV